LCNKTKDYKYIHKSYKMYEINIPLHELNYINDNFKYIPLKT